VRGKLDGFSIGHLYRFLNAFGNRMYSERFVELYGPEDGWKANARATLEGLGRG